MNYDKYKVLVCDDSLFARKNLVKVLNSVGITKIYEASDGQEALDLYGQIKPDIVFMDIVMPVISGIEAVERILHINISAKIVMVSSVGTQSYLKDAINAGAMDFIQKPVSADNVVKVINRIMKED